MGLDRACREKFQKGLAELMQGMGAVGGMGGLGLNAEIDLTTATFTMPTEDSAKVSIAGVPEALSWKLSENEWKLEVGLEKLQPGVLDALLKVADPLAGSVSKFCVYGVPSVVSDTCACTGAATTKQNAKAETMLGQSAERRIKSASSDQNCKRRDTPGNRLIISQSGVPHKQRAATKLS